ncbi:MAG: polysaccharide lyase family 7 protein, partial [Bacteroidota bacterium]
MWTKRMAKVREGLKVGKSRAVSASLALTGLLIFCGGHGLRAQSPDLPPGSNFDLSIWKITLPDQSEIEEEGLVNGFERANEFYTDPETGAMVFRCRNDGETGGSTYPRSELREMLRAGNTSISTKGINENNWVFSNSSQASQQAAGGVDGVLTATVSVDHVSTTGESSKVGRVIIGQIHASDNEPCRLYYRKLPQNSKGVIYFAHEPNTTGEQWYEMIGSRSSSASNPEDGIELGEVFSYEIRVEGDLLTVTIMRDDKPDVQEVVDMSDSGFED